MEDGIQMMTQVLCCNHSSGLSYWSGMTGTMLVLFINGGGVVLCGDMDVVLSCTGFLCDGMGVLLSYV